MLVLQFVLVDSFLASRMYRFFCSSVTNAVDSSIVSSSASNALRLSGWGAGVCDLRWQLLQSSCSLAVSISSIAAARPAAPLLAFSQEIQRLKLRVSSGWCHSNASACSSSTCLVHCSPTHNPPPYCICSRRCSRRVSSSPLSSEVGLLRSPTAASRPHTHSSIRLRVSLSLAHASSARSSLSVAYCRLVFIFCRTVLHRLLGISVSDGYMVILCRCGCMPCVKVRDFTVGRLYGRAGPRAAHPPRTDLHPHLVGLEPCPLDAVYTARRQPY
jgi:hypothetical protein